MSDNQMTEAETKTRRDWWLVLAGTPLGNRRSIDGISFPVLKACRRRAGFPPDVPFAVEKTPHELAPSIKQQTERWGKKFRRATR